MANQEKDQRGTSKNPKQSKPSLSLKIETTDKKHPNVNADDFFATAERWLRALKAFASEQGQHVEWEIIDLRKSSALIEVQPVTVKTKKPVATLVKKWDAGIRKIEKTGRPPSGFNSVSLGALQDFVFDLPKDAVVSIGNGVGERLRVTALTQRRVEEAVQRLPLEPRREYVTRGSIRGRLAVLDSWDPQERLFRLQLPLAPTKPVKCIYRDASLLGELGEGFEGTVEVSGELHYKPDHPWPFAAEVNRIRVLPRNALVGLKDLVGLVQLSDGQDSISYVRSMRDVE